MLLTATEFSYLCPALINQIDGKYCIVHATSEKAETPPKSYSLQIGRLGLFGLGFFLVTSKLNGKVFMLVINPVNLFHSCKKCHFLLALHQDYREKFLWHTFC